MSSGLRPGQCRVTIWRVRREPVASESIASIGYDPDAATLEVEFTSGRVYRYFAVPASAHRRLLAADSVGAHFNAEVRTRYPHAEV
jgi:hypothetical protein